ncbi:MAG: AAA family ATPase [Bacteriovoracaceae bacterium]|nr:AAA family ATPase [Bacteriovoracaceae bacterium]
MNKYNEYFGFKSEPFMNNLPAKKLLELPGMIGVKERIKYILNLGGIMVVTGEVGSGKSSSLRWSTSHLHKSEVLVLNVIGSNGSIIEFYKQIGWELGVDINSASRTKIIKMIKEVIRDIVASKKQKILLIVDEASLLRPEIFAEIHTLTQFNEDSSNMITIVFSGQSNLIDKFKYRSSAPLASRVMGKIHLTSINRDQMEEYVLHHLKAAGVKKMLFSETAITAIQQGSGGILRRANFLAKGGLVACSIDREDIVTAEHIRIASTELL